MTWTGGHPMGHSRAIQMKGKAPGQTVVQGALGPQDSKSETRTNRRHRSHRHWSTWPLSESMGAVTTHSLPGEDCTEPVIGKDRETWTDPHTPREQETRTEVPSRFRRERGKAPPYCWASSSVPQFGRCYKKEAQCALYNTHPESLSLPNA